jgi:thiosulfate/3-mercaptopyruvate sulfurtransferase
MKNKHIILSAFLSLVLFLFAGASFGQVQKKTPSNEFMEPSKLADMLNLPKAKQPMVYNVGPVDNIKGAINIGSCSKKANLDKLRKALEKVPRDKMIVVYCGCCPMRVCPNVRPAYNLLTELGYKNSKILDLIQNLKTDWIDQGYPVE